jgi:Sulfatase
LLCASGTTALVYQILCIKQLSLVVGVDVYAVTTGVSAFFAGLALGGALFGRWADRLARPFLLYALLELGVAVLTGFVLVPALGLVRSLASMAIAAAAVGAYAILRGPAVGRGARWITLAIGVAGILAAIITPPDRLARLLTAARGGRWPSTRRARAAPSPWWSSRQGTTTSSDSTFRGSRTPAMGCLRCATCACRPCCHSSFTAASRAGCSSSGSGLASLPVRSWRATIDVQPMTTEKGELPMKTLPTMFFLMRIPVVRIAIMVAAFVVLICGPAPAQQQKPNILVIMGDDIGWFNPSVYHRGIMGYQTPNIDRIAKEGAMFTDWYGQQSCTAGRAAFVTGQSPIRTGLTKVGLPGADIGLRAEDPSVAELLKPLGYAIGQFGKNHLGDKDEFLPTNHGFDEFFGNLYHLNAEEEPENPDYPKNPEFRKRFGPRGVLHSTADGKIDDTGPLTRKRMETVDEEFLAAAFDFINRQHKAGMPFFVYFNSTRMHVFTHLKPESQGKTGLGLYPDGMVDTTGMSASC